MRNYIISPDRCLIHTSSPLIEGWEVCKDLKTLMAFTRNTPSDQKEEIKWCGPKIPKKIWENLFGTMAKFPNMEVHFNIYVRLKTGEYAIKCPKQCGYGALVHSVDNLDGMPEGYTMIGTIHTHPNMSAFWSTRDMDDQKGKHGLHFVFGLTNGKPTSYKCSVFTPWNNFYQDWDAVCEPIDFAGDYEPVYEWVEEIKKQELKPVFSWDGVDSTTTRKPLFSPVISHRDTWNHTMPLPTRQTYSQYQQKKDDAAEGTVTSGITPAELYKVTQRERQNAREEFLYSMREVLQTVLQAMIDYDGIEFIKDELSELNLICIDPEDQNTKWESVFGSLFQSYAEQGYPSADRVNDVIAAWGFEPTETTLMEQTYLNDMAMDAYEEQEAIKELNKC